MRDLIYKKYDYMDIELSNSFDKIYTKISNLLSYDSLTFLKYNLMRYVLFIREA